MRLTCIKFPILYHLCSYKCTLIIFLTVKLKTNSQINISYAIRYMSGICFPLECMYLTKKSMCSFTAKIHQWNDKENYYYVSVHLIEGRFSLIIKLFHTCNLQKLTIIHSWSMYFLMENTFTVLRFVYLEIPKRFPDSKLV